jgi:hypothetical protein
MELSSRTLLWVERVVAFFDPENANGLGKPEAVCENQ